MLMCGGTRFAPTSPRMEPLPSIALAECKGMYITATLQARPLGEGTFHFLLKDEHALDTTSGVLYGVTRDQEIRPWLRKARGGERPAEWPTNANRRHDAFA